MLCQTVTRLCSTIRWLVASIALCSAPIVAPVMAQCPLSGCCDVIATNYNPLAGQTVTVILRGGVTTPNPFICPWYGIGAMRGSIISGASATGLPASVISSRANIGYFGANVGSIGAVVTGNLGINGIDVTRACNFGGPGSIFGGCPLNNSAQDIYRFNFTVPAAALPGTVYTFTFSGAVYGISTWNVAGFGVYCPALGGPIGVGGCTATITVGGTPTNDSCGNC